MCIFADEIPPWSFYHLQLLFNSLRPNFKSMSKSNAEQAKGKGLPLPKVSFGKFKPGNFHTDVKERVNQYFLSNNISKSANSEMVIKTILILLGWSGTYFLILSNLINPLGMLGLALFHGFFAALIGMNIAHDAIHGSYTKNSAVNQKIGLIFNLVGANDYVWGISHNIVHHTYTNIPQHDGDIHQVPILRMEPTQKRDHFTAVHSLLPKSRHLQR